MTIKDHHELSMKVAKRLAVQIVASDGLRHFVTSELESVIDATLAPHYDLVSEASEAMETVIRAARNEAVNSVVNIIRRSEGIDPFVVDDAVQRWIDSQIDSD